MTAASRPSQALSALPAAAAAALVRWLWARRLARAKPGCPPGVRTDDDVLLHTQTDRSDRAALTVVFAHGFAAQLQEFDRQREALRDRAELVLFDQRGHGLSGWSDPRAATVQRLGRDLGCVVDAVAGARRVVLVGHSMGGMAVLALAAQRPELFGARIRGVALLSTSAGRLAQLAVPRPVARLALAGGVARAGLRLVWVLAPLIDAAQPFSTRLGRRWLRRRLFGHAPPSDDAVATMQRMWAEMSQSTATAFYPALFSYDQSEAPRVLARVPTLVLAGAADAAIPCRHSERLAREIGPAAHLVLVPEAGHMVNLTHPLAVNAALADLLTRADAAGRRHAAA